MSQGRTEILLFQVGPRVFAAQVFDVRRIAPADWARTGAIAATALGEPFLAQRGIVVACAGGDEVLAVDQVLGVREVAEDDLRPLPPLAAQCLGSSAVTGLALLDDAPTPLIDLSTLIQEKLRGAAAVA
ncbi:MAG TPA: chemotaxis protein CheW [Anaeromyxobacteraceae bacterium]|nr:chemotaxis protein CheW [Anaeromyxobacteraceae bacterium]